MIWCRLIFRPTTHLMPHRGIFRFDWDLYIFMNSHDCPHLRDACWADGLLLFYHDSLMELPFCGPHILHDVFPLDGELAFYLWKKKLFFRKDLELPLIFVLFLKGKQNKKENLKCDSLFGKDNMWKTKVRFGGQVTYWECTVKNRSTPLSSIMRSLLIKVKQVWQLVRKPMDTKE